MRLILLVFIFFSITSCNENGNDEFWFLKRDKDYMRVKKVFNEYVNFFPTEDSVQCLKTTWSLNSDKEYNLKVVFKFNKEYFQTKRDEFGRIAIAEYESVSDSLLVLNRFSTHENYGYPADNEVNSNLIEQDYYSELKPIPNFSNLSGYQNNSTICKLEKDFVIYVLEAKTGVFLEKQQLTNGEYMPSSWKNGYSKGVAISKQRNEMIFWVIIW